ncbi:MAG: hypothetical protein ACRDMV_15365 [Streptosporangiales bacterium]
MRPVTAWLLRANRQFHESGEPLSLGEFGRRFSGGGWPGGGKWSLSRWETGAAAVPYLAVRGYEDVLSLPPGTLTTVVDTLNRYLAPRPTSPPALARPAGVLDVDRHERLAALVDRVHTGGVMTGAEWDELTNFLSTTPAVVLPRPGTWSELAERLLTEMIIADGLPWMQRFESLNRLLSHPVGQRPAIAACASLAADRTNQVFIETVCALDGSAHADANRAVLRQLGSPTNGRAHYGALLASVRKSWHGHFSDTEARVLTRSLRGLVGDSGSDPETGALAVLVLDNLRERAGLPRVGSRSSAVVPTTGPTAGLLLGRVQAAIDIAAGAGDVAMDEVLAVLLGELLFNPVPDTRLYTGMLLKASPYAGPVADALVAELARRETLGNTLLASRLVDALCVVGGNDHASAVQRLVGRLDVPAPVRELAASWVGHMGVSATDPFWQSAVTFYGRRWTATHDDASGAILTNLVYSLGLVGNDVYLKRIRESDVPQTARQAAGWWLNIRTEVRHSARL